MYTILNDVALSLAIDNKYNVDNRYTIHVVTNYLYI